MRNLIFLLLFAAISSHASVVINSTATNSGYSSGGGGGGADVHLSNISAVTLGSSLYPATDSTLNFGSGDKSFVLASIQRLGDAGETTSMNAFERYLATTDGGAALTWDSDGEVFVSPRNSVLRVAGDIYPDNSNRNIGTGGSGYNFRDMFLINSVSDSASVITLDLSNRTINNNAGTVLAEFGNDIINLGEGSVGTVGLPGYNSCIALTTDGSGVIGCTASDEALKRDIVPFARGLESLKDIKPVSFKFKNPKDLGIEHTGFIAQNVEKSISEAVRIGSDGMRQLDYWAIIAAQTNAINELRERLEALEGGKVKVKDALPQKPIWVAAKAVPHRPMPPIKRNGK